MHLGIIAPVIFAPHPYKLVHYDGLTRFGCRTLHHPKMMHHAVQTIREYLNMMRFPDALPARFGQNSGDTQCRCRRNGRTFNITTDQIFDAKRARKFQRFFIRRLVPRLLENGERNERFIQITTVQVHVIIGLLEDIEREPIR